MTIENLGEFKLIERLMTGINLPHLSGIEGIGDDCAVLPYQDDQSLLVTTDMLIENNHFILKKISPFDLGYKSLAVNLSDIAAMGGIPLYAFLSLGLPSTTPTQWIDQFFAGFHALAQEYTVFLLGGDTTKADLVTINVTLIGKIETRKIKRRSQAKLDDLICCTGFLGDSGAGLKLLLNDFAFDHPLIQSHFRPYPYVQEGHWLAQHTAIHAMIDVSDGIASDLKHILQASSCGANIYLNQLPISNHLKQIADQKKWDVEEIALTAGEDYCLLFTVDPTAYPSIAQAYEAQFHHPLFVIGQITNLSQELMYYSHHQVKYFHKPGFDHFLK